MNRTKLLEACMRSLREGDLDAVVAQRVKLRDSLQGDWPEEDLLLARACCAQVHLVLVDRRGAAECLEPFVEVDDAGRPEAKETEIKRLEHRGSFGAGAVLAQVANALYRSLTFDAGVNIAERADTVLRSCRDATEPDRLLTLWENRIWWSRLLWHHGKQARAEALLETTLNEVAQESGPFENLGGVNLVTAIGLNLWASFDWIRGRVQDARRRIYRALFLLGGLQDQVRFAHCLFVAGRIEATHSTSGFRVAMGLLKQAQERFGSLERPHPFLARATIQEAQCQIKAGLIDDAEDTLERVKTLDIDDAVEQMVTRADYLLSRSWILERKARDDATMWQECLSVTRELNQIASKSQRLELEGRLHYGRSLVQQPSRKDLDEGQQLIVWTQEKARIGGRKKIEVAATFALAESYLVKHRVHGRDSASHFSSPDLDSAKAFWEAGVRQLGDLESTFLRRWLEEIGDSLGGTVTLKIDANLTLDEAMKALREKYVRYHERRIRPRREMAEAMGVSQSTLYHLLNRYGSRLKSKKKPRR